MKFLNVLLNQGIRLIAQIGYLLILARILTARDYSIFGGILAMTALFGPFSNLSAGIILIREHIHSKLDIKIGLATSLYYTVIFSSFSLVLFMITNFLIFNDKVNDTYFIIALTALIGISEIMIGKIIEVLTQAFQAVGKAEIGSAIPTISSFIKLLGVITCLLLDIRDIYFIIQILLISTLIGLSVTVLYTRYFLGRFTIGKFIQFDFKSGFMFSFSQASQGMINNFDKTSISSSSVSYNDSASYILAYKFVEAIGIAYRSFNFSIFANLFKDSNNLKIKSYFYRSLAIGIISGGLLIIASFLVKKFFTEEYSGAASLLMLFAPLPIFQSFTALSNDILSARNKQIYRTYTQIAIFLVILVFYPIVIRNFGVSGLALFNVFINFSIATISGFLAIKILMEKKSVF